MPETVFVSHIDNNEKLRAHITDLFQKGRYEEISRAIGMHSILIDPQHTLSDQAQLYRFVLEMIKNRIGKAKDKAYSSWLAAFPKLLSELVASRQVVTDEASTEVIASHHDAYGPFRSVDDFYLWALDDRRLTLEQIVKYIEKTAQIHRG
jgi:hypothetical protein